MENLSLDVKFKQPLIRGFLWLGGSGCRRGWKPLEREGCSGEQGEMAAVDSVIRGGSPAACGLGKAMASGDSAQAQCEPWALMEGSQSSSVAPGLSTCSCT